MKDLFFIFVSVSVLTGSTYAGEWLTARGEHCISKCKYDGKEHYYYWCHTSDPTRFYSDGKFWWRSSDRSGLPDTRVKWDYCVPSEIPLSPYHNPTTGRPPYDNPTTGRPPYNKGNLPALEKDNYDLIYGVANYSKGALSVLYPPVECSGECLASGQRSVCDLKSNHPAAEGDFDRRWFYCVNEKPFKREQISANYRLWCLDRCRKEGNDHFWCNTLYGADHCSPSPNVGSQGTRCLYPCEGYTNWLDGKYSFCYTNRQNTTWEYCGNFTVPEDKKTIVEFTRYDNVCADYCKWDDDNTYQYCYYVYWDYNSTTNTADLMKSWEYCRGYHPAKLSGLEIAMIILGVIVGIVALALLVGWLVK